MRRRTPVAGRMCRARRRWSVLALAALPVTLVACTPAGPPPRGPAPPSAMAASSPAAPPAPPTPAPIRTVVLDPGHNGGNADHPDQIAALVPDGRGGTKSCNTTGTSTDAGYAEHAFTWDLAQRVSRVLRAHGVRVVLTRPDDTGVGPCVDRRAAIGNEAGTDAVISLHADGATSDARGFHVAYSSPPLSRSQGAPSRTLADAVVEAMTAHGFTPATYIGEQGLDPRADLAGLNGSRVPAVLVECANMRHPADAATVSDPVGRDRYADAIGRGILTWLERQPQ